MDHEGNGWSRWEKVVLSRLDRMESSQDKMNSSIVDIRMDILSSKTESKIEHKLFTMAWGAMGALIPVCLDILFQLFRK